MLFINKRTAKGLKPAPRVSWRSTDRRSTLEN